MIFAERIGKVSLSGIRHVFEKAGPDSINLGLGEPDFDTPRVVKEEVWRALEEGETSYTENRGRLELRELVAERYNSLYGTSFGEENVLITSGASEALHLAIQCFVDPGDEVVVPDPGFVSYRNLAVLADGEVKSFKARQETGFKLEPDSFNEFLTGDEALVVLNSPCNPTGTVYSKGTVKGLTETCLSKGVPVLSDEVYDQFVYRGKHSTPASFTDGGDVEDGVVVVNSFSKTFAMTGWRLGYMLAPGDVVDACLKPHQYMQACASSVSQAAGIAALTKAKGFVEEMVEVFRERRNVLIQGLRDLGVDCVEPEGAFYAFPDFTRFGGGPRVAEVLAENGLLVVPGSAFGSFTGNVRVSYAVCKKELRKGLKILEKVLPGLES